MAAYSRAKRGQYHPINKEKYKGDINGIVFRSSLEFRFMRYCDMSDDVAFWASEELIIKYLSPKDGKVHRYFTDFVVWFANGTKWIVEIKPDSQTKVPKTTARQRPKTIREAHVTFHVNQAKWAAAKHFAAERGYEFRVITEKELNRGHFLPR